MIYVQPESPRYQLMDVSRGFGILGILWLNIFFFSLPFEAIVIPGIWGVHNDANIAAWDFVSIGVAGVMRGMISIVFGATALLLLRKAEKSNDGFGELDRFFKRLLLLIAFGLVHSYLLIWPHDILYVYGVLGLLIFPFRNFSSRHLLTLAMIMLAGSIFFTAHNSNEIQDARQTLDEALTDEEIEKLREGDPLIENFEGSSLWLPQPPNALPIILASNDADLKAPAQQQSEEQQQSEDQAVEQGFNDMVQRIDEDVAARLGGYVDNVKYMANQSFQEQTEEMLTNHLFDVATFFLFGMLLLKVGFLTHEWSTPRYLTLMVICYTIGISLGLVTVSEFTEGSLLYEISYQISEYTYDLRRLTIALGNLSLLALALRFSIGGRLLNCLHACGRLALTLYIGQTIVCNLIFLGFGLGWFGQLEHIEILSVAAFLTLVQLIIAPVYFRYWKTGPMEALLRNLIDWRLPQPAR